MVVTPLSQERAQVHDAGQRFLNNFRASAGDVAEESSEGEFRMYLMQAAKTSRMGRCQVSIFIMLSHNRYMNETILTYAYKTCASLFRLAHNFRHSPPSSVQ